MRDNFDPLGHPLVIYNKKMPDDVLIEFLSMVEAYLEYKVFFFYIFFKALLIFSLKIKFINIMKLHIIYVITKTINEIYIKDIRDGKL